MRSLLIALILFPAMAFGQSAGQDVGSSLVSENRVTIGYAGSTRNLGVGDPVVFGGTIVTGDEGANVDQFVDGSRLTVAPNSSVEIDKFVYQADANAGEAVIQLTKGALRFVSGKMRSESYQVNTRFAVLGIRGTRFVVVHSENDGTTVIVEDGLVDFSNGRGASVDVAAGKFSRIDRLGGPPSEPADIGAGEAAAVASVNASVGISAAPSVSMPGVVGDLANSAAEASSAAASAPATNSNADFGGDGRY